MKKLYLLCLYCTALIAAVVTAHPARGTSGREMSPASPRSQTSDLVYSTFLGGDGGDSIRDVTRDRDGNLYLVGSSESSDFPPITPGALNGDGGGSRAFVIKLSPDAKEILFAAAFGGSEGDRANAVAVDAEGNVTVAGSTGSRDFPATAGAYDTTCDNFICSDAFVARLSADGSRLLFATYLGGDGYDRATQVALAPDGDIIVAGWNGYCQFPTTPQAFDPYCNGGQSIHNWGDGFITRFNNTASQLIYSTYLGGENGDSINGMFVNGVGEVTVIGSTRSANFPTTPGAYDVWCGTDGDCNETPQSLGYGGPADGFLAKLSAFGSFLHYATFIGGSGADGAHGVFVDALGYPVIVGSTSSYNFPTTADAYDSSYNGETDAFIARFSGTASTLLHATFMGGSNDDSLSHLQQTPAGGFLLAGHTTSTYLRPIGDGYDDSYNGEGDIFLLELDDALQPIQGTFLGGIDSEEAYALDGNDDSVLLVGTTRSYDFPVTGDAFDNSCGSDGTCNTDYSPVSDAFLTILGQLSSISGRVTDSNGAGVPEVTVWAGFPYNATTDADGYYTISVAEAGTYGVYVQAHNSFTPTETTVSVPPNATGVDFVAEPVDLEIAEVAPVQVLEDQPLVEGKKTAVKVVVRRTGEGAVEDVPLRLSHNGEVHDAFWVVDPDNTDSSTNQLLADSYPLDITAGQRTKTVYFIGDGLTPESTEWQATATVDPENVVLETDEGNNSLGSASATVFDTQWGWPTDPDMYIHYFQADWVDQQAYGRYFDSSTAFVRALFPVSERRFQPDFSIDLAMTSQLYRGADNRLDDEERAYWLAAINLAGRLAHPTADGIVAVVPPDWFQAFTNRPDRRGEANPILNVAIVEASSDVIAAHEIGHLFDLPSGLADGCREAYEACNPERMDGIGDFAGAGFWEDRRIPMTPSASRPIYTYMGAIANVEYWAEIDDYGYLLQENQAFVGPVGATLSGSYLVRGLLYDDGTATLLDWYTLSQVGPEPPAGSSYILQYQDANGQVVHEEGFDVDFYLEGEATDVMAFAFLVPRVEDATSLVLLHGQDELARRSLIGAEPTVQMEPIVQNGPTQVTLSWIGSDSDSQSLTYTLLYSADGGQRWDPLLPTTTETSFTWHTIGMTPSDSYLVRVIATDGVHTGEDVLDETFTITGRHYLPTLRR